MISPGFGVSPARIKWKLPSFPSWNTGSVRGRKRDLAVLEDLRQQLEAAID